MFSLVIYAQEIGALTVRSDPLAPTLHLAAVFRLSQITDRLQTDSCKSQVNLLTTYLLI